MVLQTKHMSPTHNWTKRNKLFKHKDTEDSTEKNGTPQPIEGPVLKVYKFIF